MVRGSEGLGEQLPVDRGWAWVVVAGAAALCGVQGSMLRTGGLMLVFMREHFADEQSLALWVIGLSGPLAMLFGPLLSILIRKTSHRFVAVTGSIVAAAGTASTGFLPTIKAGFFTFSIISGCGILAMYLVSLTCTTPYFDRRRGLAIGLVSAGTGVMSLILPNVLTSLYETYGFGGTMLLYGGIILQGAVFGCLIRPTSYYNCGGTTMAASAPLERVVARSVLKGFPIDDEQPLSKSLALNASEEPQEQQQKCNLSEQRKNNATFTHKTFKPATNDQKYLEKRHRIAAPRLSGDTPNPACHDSSNEPVGDTPLLQSEEMWIAGVMMLFAVNALCILYTAVPPRGDAIGVPRAVTSVLIAVSGGVEIFFRGLQGWLADQRLVPTLVQFGLSAGAAGVCVALCPVIGGVAGLGLATVACGAFGMPLYSLIVLILRDLLGASRVTSAMGLLMLVQIVSYMVSVVVMDQLADLDSDSRYIFYYIGANFMLSSVSCMAYVLVTKMRREASHRHESAP